MNVWGLTDIGKSRPSNQDSFQVIVSSDETYSICIVCDGMGGANAGNVASKLAVDAFVAEVTRIMKPGLTQKQLSIVAESAATAANKAVFTEAKEHPDYQGMGTTLVGLIAEKERGVIVNIGDSRAYRINEDGITRLTRDHSVVEEMLQSGRLSVEEAKHYPGKNLITRAVGTEANVSADTYSIEIGQDDYILLCSDGLTNTVDENEMLYQVVHGGDPSYACKRLVDLANSRGGPDNITAVLFGA